MKGFRYVAARPDGRRVRGRLDAASVEGASHQLADRGLFPLAVDPERPAPRWPWQRASARAVATAIQALAELTVAGVPLQRALDAAAALTGEGMREALCRVRDRVREGSSLWAALANEGDRFPPVVIGLVQAGERGVGLGPALAQAAAYMERAAETRASVRAALAYPALLLLVGCLSIGFILLFVLPRFAVLLADTVASLPAATRGLLAASATVRGHGLLVLVLVAASLAVGVRAVLGHREALMGRVLDVPLVGSIGHGLATARVSRTLGALLRTGVPALSALAVARDTAGDAATARRLALAHQRVAEGWALSDALEASAALTAGAVQLARIGEASGRLPDLLEQAAALEERAAADRIRMLVAALEPALIIAFAAAVAFIAGALLQAIYSVQPGAP